MTTTVQNNITGTLTEYSAWGANKNPNSPLYATNCSPDLANTNIDLAKKRDIQHLFSRMTFGANLMDINWALTKTPAKVVDILVDLAVGETNVTAPGLDVHKWGDKHPNIDIDLISTDNNWTNRLSLLRAEWTNGMIGKNSPNDTVNKQEIDRAKRFKYKMSLFWHNHFTTKSARNISATMWYKYALIFHAVGNFKTFTKDIGLSQAMLTYLDADTNRYLQQSDWKPNENYARELLELFTMGAATSDVSDDNDPSEYTQEDIEELSKVFSGWRYESWSPNPPKFREYVFQPNLHYWGMKKIFGETIIPNSPPSNVDILSNNPNNHVARSSNIPIWDHPLTYYGGKDAFGIEEAYDEYEEVHDIIFGERNSVIISAVRQDRIAKFICSKIYKEFVYEEIDEDIVEELADCFITNNWELAPVLKMLFKSEHFFNSATRGAQIQSHQGAFISLYSTLGLEYGVDYFPSGRFFDAQFDPTDPYGYTDWTTPPQVASVGTAHVPIHHSIKDMGHIFFEPPNVAGWPGHRTWINEYTLYKLGDELGKHIQNNFNDSRTPTRQRWRELMIDLVGWDSNDPTEVTKAVAEHFLIVDLLPEQLDGAVAAFKSPVDKSHFNGGFWKLSYMPPMDEDNVVKQFIALMKYLFRLPENFMT